ncbi:fatty acyl-AMP ligase [Streptomyces sp. HPF1205]|uniref:fatty acyl-AMP ligase n=1 Tax=Streptomyces sp. HPF1205 TaxID=2873262 RepID=UPI001CEC93F7|nr:fatty acyl-AMP ligase [Streptomyces sp. HPF1205]
METQLTGPTISALLGDNATRRGEKTAYTFLDNGHDESRTLTYRQLDEAARAVAVRLLESVRPGGRAMILAAGGADFVTAFMACQHAGVIAVPVAPPQPPRDPRKAATLRAIAQDSGAEVVLTGSATDLRTPVCEVAPELGALEWIDVDTIAPSAAAGFRAPAIASEDISFLQYTSGSTSLPKGVMVSHRALLRNEEMFAHIMGLGSEDVIVSWLPLYHDMGLIGMVLQNLYLGAHIVMMPPLAFVQRPSRWLRAITRYRATFTGAPDFAYDACVRRIREEDRAEFDLSSLRVAFSGAEPIRTATLESFAKAYTPYGLDPGALMCAYGLAEATLVATGTVAGQGPTTLPVDREALRGGRIVPGTDHLIVGVGKPRLSREVLIVDPETLARCEPGRIGEIWLAGADIPPGYWRNPGATEETYRAYTSDSGAGPYLRTGDLGGLYDGELYITGRLKDLVIVGGRNHYPQDIEATAEAAHPWVRYNSSAAFAVERDGREQVALVVEVLRPQGARRHTGSGERAPVPTLAQIKRAVTAAVAAEHGIQLADVHMVVPGSVARTSSGKIQRRANRAAYESGRFTPAPEPANRALGRTA